MEKVIKAIEEYGKPLAESNALIKKYDYDNEKDFWWKNDK